MVIKGLLSLISSPRVHQVQCPRCGGWFGTQALYEVHWYQEHAEKRFNDE